MRVGDERSLACFTLRDSLNGVTYIMHKLETKRNQKKKEIAAVYNGICYGLVKQSRAAHGTPTAHMRQICLYVWSMVLWLSGVFVCI